MNNTEQNILKEKKIKPFIFELQGDAGDVERIKVRKT
jgi:hypothetical protein